MNVDALTELINELESGVVPDSIKMEKAAHDLGGNPMVFKQLVEANNLCPFPTRVACGVLYIALLALRLETRQ